MEDDNGSVFDPVKVFSGKHSEHAGRYGNIRDQKSGFVVQGPNGRAALSGVKRGGTGAWRGMERPQVGASPFQAQSER